MRVIEFSREHARPIELFDSVAASAVHLGDGAGEAHVYCLHFEAGGVIGAHVAGFGQLLLVVAGEGWAAGADGRRVTSQPVRASSSRAARRTRRGARRG